MSVRVAIRRFLVALRLPQALPAVGFAAVILIGSALLWLPWSHTPDSVGYLDALFTSTSAVCVTGLVTVNTATDYTVAGQVIIILLIQIGGLGVMAYAAMALSLLGRRISLRAQAALHDSLFQKDQARDFKRLFRQIIGITLAVEAAGAILMFFSLLPGRTAASAAWQAVFHSISSFCNAGFSIFPNNLVDIRSNHVFMVVVMVLIVLGGLGFMVLHELFGETMRVRQTGPRARTAQVHPAHERRGADQPRPDRGRCGGHAPLRHDGRRDELGREDRSSPVPVGVGAYLRLQQHRHRGPTHRLAADADRTDVHRRLARLLRRRHQDQHARGDVRPHPRLRHGRGRGQAHGQEDRPPHHPQRRAPAGARRRLELHRRAAPVPFRAGQAGTSNSRTSSSNRSPLSVPWA